MKHISPDIYLIYHIIYSDYAMIVRLHDYAVVYTSNKYADELYDSKIIKNLNFISDSSNSKWLYFLHEIQSFTQSNDWFKQTK